MRQDANTENKWQWLKTQPEGQFYERKSCYDRSKGRLRRRNVRSVAQDIAETLSAMANADGGTLAVGIEDDGAVTGVDYPHDRLKVLEEAPKARVRPSLKARYQWVKLDGRPVLVFEVDWSPEVHQLTDGRYLLRVGESNMPFPAEDIQAMKAAKRRRLTEMRFVPEAALSDLDTELLETLRQKTGFSGSDEEILLRYHLAEHRNGRILLTLGALLLFSKDPLRWHPVCFVDFVKWEGTERRFGAELNIVKRARIEGPLPRLIQKAFETIQPHIRERHRLVDLFFEERFEYPTFAWQEAIINAIAHRDYALEGTPVEVWLFEDRMEVRSPGELVEPVTIERLQRRERIHASRNPRLVRVLTDFGFMREMGEGIPRMFEVMEQEGLKPPEFRLEAGAIFTVILRNTTVYDVETIRWLKQFEHLSLTPNQKRLLAYAHVHGDEFTSREYQKLVTVDIYTASKDIRDLMRKGVVCLPKKGGRIYKVIAPQEREKGLKKPEELLQLEPILKEKGYLTNQDVRRTLGVSRARAKKLLDRWVTGGWLKLEGRGRGARYKPSGNGTTYRENGPVK